MFNHNPFCYRRNGHSLELKADEQAVIAEMRRLRSNDWTLQRIADNLTSDGVTPKQAGGRWYPSAPAKTVKAYAALGDPPK